VDSRDIGAWFAFQSEESAPRALGRAVRIPAAIISLPLQGLGLVLLQACHWNWHLAQQNAHLTPVGVKCYDSRDGRLLHLIHRILSVVALASPESS